MPEVKLDTWIKIKSTRLDSGIDGYVLGIFDEKEISVGYYQNDAKVIKETVVWKDGFWCFKYSDPNGSYLRGKYEAIVKRGP